MTLRLENLQKSLLQSWESKFSSNEIQRKLASIYKEGSSMAKLAESTEDAALRSLLKSAGESGYKLENAEGTFFQSSIIQPTADIKCMLRMTSAIILRLWPSNRSCLHPRTTAL